MRCLPRTISKRAPSPGLAISIPPYRAFKLAKRLGVRRAAAPLSRGGREPKDWEAAAAAIVCWSWVSRNLRTRGRGRELLGEGYTV